jgi:hypothetical protein
MNMPNVGLLGDIPAQGAGTSGVPADAVIALVAAIARAGDPRIARAVAQMLQSAASGQQLNIDMQGLGIPQSVLAPVLEAVGNSGAQQGNALSRGRGF